MKINPRNPPGQLLKLASLALLLAACASGAMRREEAPEEPPVLYGVAGNQLVRVDPADGAATAVASSPELTDVGALTYDPGLDVFYAIADAGSDPRLIAIEPATGEVITIGPIDLPAVDLSIAGGLAYDPADGRLYAAAGRSDFASNLLLEVDVATGEATELGRIRGTVQDDVDALTLVGGTLCAVDSAGRSSALYEIDRVTGAASAVGTTFPGVTTALAHDAAGRRLIAAVEGSRLLAIPLGGGEARTLGPTHGAAELGGAQLTALALVRPAAGPYRDDFESGDLSAWSVQEPDGDRPERR